MKKELKRRIITVIVGAVIMCMVSLVPEMVQAYAFDECSVGGCWNQG